MDGKARDRIYALIANSGAEFVSVAFSGINGEDEFLIRPDESYHAASTMKLCVLVDLFHQAASGAVGLDQQVTVHNEFPSLVDGSLFSVAPEDDSYAPLHRMIGKTQTLIELARPMITHSSNLATNLVIESLGVENITGYMRELGAEGLVVTRYIEDAKAYRAGLNTTVTARGLSTVLQRLARGELSSQAASEAMLTILLGQTHRNYLPSKIPREAQIANKPGWNDLICHDAGIIYPPSRSPFVLTVLTRGLERQPAANLIGAIAATAYHAWPM